MSHVFQQVSNGNIVRVQGEFLKTDRIRRLVSTCSHSSQIPVQAVEPFFHSTGKRRTGSGVDIAGFFCPTGRGFIETSLQTHVYTYSESAWVCVHSLSIMVWVFIAGMGDSDGYYVNRVTGETRHERPASRANIIAASTNTEHHYQEHPSKSAAVSAVNRDLVPKKRVTTAFFQDITNKTPDDSRANLFQDITHGSATGFKRVLVERDECGKISRKSKQLAWQHYLRNRPIMDEAKNLPCGFLVDPVTSTVICDPITGEPQSTWTSILSVPLREFTDLGPGIKLTFDFMWEGGVFFFVMWVCGSVGWMVQLSNPRSIDWVNLTFLWDIFFILFYIGFMVYLRRRVKIMERVVDNRNVTTQDYSLQIDGLPKDATAQEVKIFCSRFGPLFSDPYAIPTLFNTEFNSHGVALIRNDSNVIRTAYDIIELERTLASMDPLWVNKRVGAEKNLSELKEEHNRLKQNSYCCTGTAFVTFDLPAGRDKCLKAFKDHIREGPRSSFPMFRGRHKLTFKVPPEPSDILWKNLEVSQCEVTARQCIVGLLSGVYLFLVGLVMVYCAAYNKTYATEFKGLLGTLGNVLCCLTSIVFLMPMASLFERVHTRTMLEVVTFSKIAWFQTMGVLLSTFYVFGLDENAVRMQALSSEQINHWGSGLPTKYCNISRFHAETAVASLGYPTGLAPADVALFRESECWSFTLHLFGTELGMFLIGNLVGDILLINMIDFVCPPWWIEMLVLGKGSYYQTDLERAHVGVDFKPFLRYQILLKFLFVGMAVSCVDNPRVLTLWIVVCYFQCYGIDKFCFITRYRAPPLFDTYMFSLVVKFGLPMGLAVHLIASFFIFGVTYEWSPVSGVSISSNSLNKYGEVSAAIFVAGCLFIALWLSPLELWEFGSARVSGSKVFVDDVEADEMAANLKFSEALVAHELELPISKLKKIEVARYIPDPMRREFGVMKVN